MSTDVEAMDTPTEDTAVAAAIDTPLPSDTRTDSLIRQLTMVRRQDDQQ